MSQVTRQELIRILDGYVQAGKNAEMAFMKRARSSGGFQTAILWNADDLLVKTTQAGLAKVLLASVRKGRSVEVVAAYAQCEALRCARGANGSRSTSPIAVVEVLATAAFWGELCESLLVTHDARWRFNTIHQKMTAPSDAGEGDCSDKSKAVNRKK